MDSLWENYRQFIKNNKLISKSQQRFRIKKHKLLKKVYKITSSANDNKRIQLMDSIKTYAYGYKWRNDTQMRRD